MSLQVTSHSPSTIRLTRPHCRQAVSPSTPKPSGSNDSPPVGSIACSHTSATAAVPSPATSTETSTVGASRLPPRASSVAGGFTSRRADIGGSVIVIRRDPATRLPNRIVVSVTALRPSIRTALSLVARAAGPRPAAASPTRSRTSPASPRTVTTLPPAGSAATAGSTDSAATATSGAVRLEAISICEATAAGTRTAKASKAVVDSTGSRPSSTTVCRTSAPAASGAASNHARYPLRPGSTSTIIRPGPSCRGGAERIIPPDSSGIGVQPPWICLTVNSTVAGQVT